MFPRIQFVTTSLWNRYDKTSAKATAHKNCHYAEVENNGTMGIHLFDRCNTIFHFVSKIAGITAFWWNLTKWSWFVQIYLRIELNKRKWQLSSNRSSMPLSYLCKICYLILKSWLDGVKLVPEIFLYFAHITPRVHSIGFNVFNRVLIFFLFWFFTFDIDHEIGIFWSFNNNISYLLWSLNFIDFHVFLKSLLYDIWNWHVIHFLWGFDFSIWDKNFTFLIISLHEAISRWTRRVLYLSKRNRCFSLFLYET